MERLMFLALLSTLGTFKLKYYKNCIVVLWHPKYGGFPGTNCASRSMMWTDTIFSHFELTC